MANKSVELPVTPELTKSCEVEIRRYSADKASSGNSDEKVVPHYLRASTGSCHDFCKYGRKHAFEVKERRSIPNRATRKQLHQSSEASIGGITLSVARPQLSVDSKPAKKMSTVILKESVDSIPKKKMSMVINKESVDSKTHISDASDTNTDEMPSESFDGEKHIGNEVNRKKKTLVKVKPSLLKSHTSPPRRQGISSSTVKEVESTLKSTSRKVETQSKSTAKKVITPSSSTAKKVRTASKSTPDKVETLTKSTLKKVESPSKSTPKKVKTPSKLTPDKVETLSKSTLKKVENPSKSTSEVKTSSKSTSKVFGTSPQLSSLNGEEKKLSEKHVTSLSSNHVTWKKISSMNSSKGFSDRKISEIKMEKGVASSKNASKKSMAPIKALSSPRLSLRRVASINSRKLKSLKIVSHLRNQKTPRKVEPEEHNNNNNNNNEVEEKTLYVITMENENKTLQQSDQNTSFDDELYLPQLSSPKSSSSTISQSLPQEDQEESESEYATSEFEEDSLSGNHKIECVENEGALEVEKKGKARRKNGIVCHEEDKDNNQMIKLKFRRGKVVDNQIDKSSPRRLKFRRAKMLVAKANVKDDAQRKSFKRKDEEASTATTGPEKVVLRHQDMQQDKKDGQGLLNNVIEETASKLVETRKSKVKALVGAFETVISLHDKKPSANTVS